MCKKRSSCFPNIEDRKGGKKQQQLISRGPFDHHMSYLICLKTKHQDKLVAAYKFLIISSDKLVAVH